MERKDTGRADDPLIGRVLDGRYQIGEQVASGGMATVYQAEDLRLERTVAVKVMHAGLVDDPEFVARFEREARSAARLSHHNVVSVFDQGADRGTLFLVMEYVPGITLRDVIRREAPIDAGRALALIEPVLAALAAAHAAGIIHRDVKPENVLIADDGRVKVADFGLARAVNAETQHTAAGGVLIGTVSYLSPELVVDGRADARSDVYAAGVLIYEMLTGVKPHQAENPIQVAYKHVHEDIPAPSLRVPELPAYVDALVARATARDRDLRPSDARVLLHQVRRVRQALDHGIVDDPELVADLLPSSRHQPDSIPTGVIPVDRAAVRAHDEVYDQAADADYDDYTEPVVRTGPVRTGPVRTGPLPTGSVRPPTRDSVPPPLPPEARRPLAEEPVVPGPKRDRSRRRGMWALVAVLVLALAAGVGAWQLGRYTTVPSLEGLQVADAKTRLARADLKLRLGTPEYSTEVAKDSIIGTNPDPGDRIGKGDTVTVVVSLGPELTAVPTLKGKTVAEATAILEGVKLEVGTVTQRYAETIPKGQVIRSNPAAGEDQPLGTLIDLTVSKGREPVAIPNYTGKKAKTAEKKLKELGFQVRLTEDFSDTVKTGDVISQTPNSGKGFKKDTITLVVSKGVEMIEIPKVRRKSATEAQALLEGLGFRVEVRQSALYLGYNVVAGSDPDAGTLAPHGSVVVLTVI